MDSQRSSLLSWAYFCQGKTMEELSHSLVYTTLQLEETRVVAQDELRKKDDQLIHLKDLLSRAIIERDEAQEKCQRLLLEKLLLQQQLQQLQQQQQQQQQQNAPLSGVSSIEDEPRKGIDSNNGFSSSDCEESIVSSPVIDPIPQSSQLPTSAAAAAAAPPPPQAAAASTVLPQGTIDIPEPEKPLPEKGKLLQAVMKAGPLLQTLLLAGPLPQWRHPPPPLESSEIPPVTISSPPAPAPPPPPQLFPQDSLINISGCNRKRVLYDGSDSPVEAKYQRIILH